MKSFIKEAKKNKEKVQNIARKKLLFGNIFNYYYIFLLESFQIEFKPFFFD